jgi:outer membrane receptor protein involved in Fe transport
VSRDIEVDNEEAYSGELQHLYRSEYLNTVTGVGYFDIDRKEEETTGQVIFVPFFPPPGIVAFDTVSEEDRDIKHTNLYLYTYLNLLQNLTLTVGASGDFYDAETSDEDEDQFNPKFGLSWNPFTSTTLRGAVFRTLKRTLITDQTLEPTQVAGFNQFFDDINGTETWHYGGAIDQKFTDSIYGGAEYTYRDLDVPWSRIVGATREVDNLKWDEKVFRAYLFWTPHEWLALSADWLWERLERGENFTLGARIVETNYVPLGVNFFHPTGLSASLKGTWVDQQGSFGESGSFENGEDDFWLLDAVIRYRFPKRYGFLTVGVTNLTDEEFEHFDSDFENARIQPDRVFFGSITLALP